MSDKAGPIRETTVDERAVWGLCPVCRAEHGEPCNPDVGLQLGQPVGGGRIKAGNGVHLSRIQNAPMRVREVPA